MITSADKKIWQKARLSYKNAYAPYSDFPVGALLVAKGGKTFIGVNVENGVNGASICAERSAVCSAVSAGVRKFDAICIIAPTKTAIYPCGICLQTLTEFCSPDLKVIVGNQKRIFNILKLSDIYPKAFDLRQHQSN
jgi:cytidine deaminase